jgi:hypothetical protein
MPSIRGRDQERMRFRLLVIGVPQCYIKEYLTLVERWVTCNGIEWTISRLKSLKVDLFRRKAGLTPLTWVRKNRKGDLAGSLGGLFRWADKSERNFKIVVQALMLYTFWCYTKTTAKQLKKFISAVQAPPTPIAQNILSGVSRVAKKFAAKVALPVPDPMLVYEGSSEKKAPRPFGRNSVPQDVAVMDEFHHFNTSYGHYLYTKYQAIFDPLLVGYPARRKWLSTLRESSKPDIYVGNIAFLQEPGGKLRSVASPYRLFQQALKPLGDFLYRVARRMPWDCTFDQSAAFDPIRCALEKGTTVHSVDLSSATDLFPLEIQVEVLRSLVLPESHSHIDLWVDLCRGLWKAPENLGYIQWTKGQPLGMFPSFAAFTVSHGCLLRSLQHGAWNRGFFVVGDDVVILDDRLADDYKETLDRIGCPCSLSKTLASERIAEFAGKIITPLGIYPQMKWRELSDDNFLDLCKALGKRSRLLLRERQRRVFDAVAHLMEPIGLNISLPGENLSDAVYRTMMSPFWDPKKAVLLSLMGLRRGINQRVYAGQADEAISEIEISELASTFDEKVMSVLRRTIFSRWETILPFLNGLASIPEALDLGPRLPLERKPPSRVSTLERYEAILQA